MLETTSGRISLHRNLKFGYFSQHHVDQLDLNLNSIELLQKGNPGKTVEEYRCQLGSFGISGDLALQSIESLSGGQKSRVTFANMCMKNPNFLVLDEPTNHLDIETIAALAKAIVKFNVSYSKSSQFPFLLNYTYRVVLLLCHTMKDLSKLFAKSFGYAEINQFDVYRVVSKSIGHLSKKKLPTRFSIFF